MPGFAEMFAGLAEEAFHDDDWKKRSRERSRLFYDRVLEHFPKHILYLNVNPQMDDLRL